MMSGNPCFSALCVLQGQVICYENCSSDFRPNQVHSMQSITKTVMHLIIGRLVWEGKINLDETVSTYIPTIGSEYLMPPFSRF